MTYAKKHQDGRYSNRLRTTIAQIGALRARQARRAGVDTLVLSHLAPAPPSSVADGQWLKQAQRHFSGRVLVGNDLDRIPVE